jgi:hypothetical protein
MRRQDELQCVFASNRWSQDKKRASRTESKGGNAGDPKIQSSVLAGLFVSRSFPVSAMNRQVMMALFAVIALVSVGCVRRRMTVRTSPAGATVSVDNQVVGTSPAATTFVYYGTREFRIEKDGYRTETIRKKIRPPWYQLPGIDFVAETLWPGEIRDERIIDVQLVPKTLEPTENLIGRADSLRTQSRVGVVTAPQP